MYLHYRQDSSHCKLFLNTKCVEIEIDQKIPHNSADDFKKNYFLPSKPNKMGSFRLFSTKTAGSETIIYFYNGAKLIAGNEPLVRTIVFTGTSEFVANLCLLQIVC